MLQFRLSVLMAALLSLIAPLLTPAASARQYEPISTPEGAAAFCSQLEAAGSFSDLHRWMHPDAKQIVPQAAVVGWYANEFAPTGPGVITVIDVQMMSWTWEVTGTTYPNTAVVSFQQPFANGTVVEDVVRLVESNGEWRWFFGRNRAFVDEQIAKYGSGPTTSGDQCAGAAEWWAETFPRLQPVQYFFNSFQPNGVIPDANMMQNYANLFATLYGDQARSSPPPAAAPLQAQLLSIFEGYHVAATNIGAIMGGNLNPLAEVGAQSAAIRQLDIVGSSLLTLGTTVETFIDTCQPVVVFAPSRGGIPQPVMPGEVGLGVSVVNCSMFSSQVEAQRFFEAAKPGDPHRLDTDNDGRACA